MHTVWPESESKGIRTPDLNVVRVDLGDKEGAIFLWLVPPALTHDELRAVAGTGRGLIALVDASTVNRATPHGHTRHVRREDVAIATRVENLTEGLAETQLKYVDLCRHFRKQELEIAFTPEQPGEEEAVNLLSEWTSLHRAAVENFYRRV